MMAAGFALGVVLTSPVAFWVGVMWLRERLPPPCVHVHVVEDASGQLVSGANRMVRSEPWTN